jgi:hypothetical protein
VSYVVCCGDEVKCIQYIERESREKGIRGVAVDVDVMWVEVVDIRLGRRVK